MPQYRTTFAVDWSPAQTFRYMANFSNSAEWDPGVDRAEQLTDDPLAVGARFAVVAKFLGRKIKRTYETVALDPPRRVLFRAESGTVVSLKEMTFEPTAVGGTVVTYVADVQLKGAMRLAAPVASFAFRRTGDRARNGMSERLSQAPPGR